MTTSVPHCSRFSSILPGGGAGSTPDPGVSPAPDFGSLVVQRRRWANGGLLILPKFLRYALGGSGRLRRLPETVLRTQYLSSTAAVNLAVLSLLLIPLDNQMPVFWLILTPGRVLSPVWPRPW